MAPTTATRAAVLTPRCAANDAPAIPPIEAAKAADDVVDTLATLARSWIGVRLEPTDRLVDVGTPVDKAL